MLETWLRAVFRLMPMRRDLLVAGALGQQRQHLALAVVELRSGSGLCGKTSHGRVLHPGAMPGGRTQPSSTPSRLTYVSSVNETTFDLLSPFQASVPLPGSL